MFGVLLYWIKNKNKNMTYIAIKVPVVESERGWGRKIDDWMVCLTIEDAQAFKKEFNSENTSSTTPDWYMQAEGDVEPINLSETQYEKLICEKRIWLSNLNHN